MNSAAKDKTAYNLEEKENPAILCLKQQIKSRTEAMGSNIRALERKAGLNVGTVNNIISGASTNPTAETLMSLANAFDCSIDELLGRKSKPQDKHIVIPTEFQSFKWSKKLFSAIFIALNNELDNRKINIGSDKALAIIQEVYLYSLKKGRDSVDDSLIEWVLDKSL